MGVAGLTFEDNINRKIEFVNRSLCEYFTKEENYQKKIYEAMEYSLFSGGKRVRPVLALAAAELFGQEESVMPFACALEMIHTYSLIHDDLPCMDNDELRRGRLTNHIVFGEAMAVLAGDALLTRAFEVVLKHSRLSPQQMIKGLAVLAEAAGTEGMIGGQVIDMECEGRAVGKDVLRAMHLHKTGALIIAAVRLGVIAGNGDSEDDWRLSAYARNLGLAFQIKDDILDVEGNTELLGKKTGMDEENRKTTFVSLYGLEQSKKMLEEYTQKAIEQIMFYGEKSEFLKEYAYFLLKRDN